jgi:hypothetical protein
MRSSARNDERSEERKRLSLGSEWHHPGVGVFTCTVEFLRRSLQIPLTAIVMDRDDPNSFSRVHALAEAR